jgi:hypothetical protein
VFFFVNEFSDLVQMQACVTPYVMCHFFSHKRATLALQLSIDPAANACFTSAGCMAEWMKHHTDESRRKRK